MKSSHKLFCPTYVLDAHVQSARGAGPPKWELPSQIGVYLGHSPFRAGSVVLVWHPTTGRVSLQYHVVFNNDFSTLPYMKSITLTQNWEDIVKYSTEISTTKYINLADIWLNGQSAEGATDQLSYPFAIVTNHKKRPWTNTPGSPSPSKVIHNSNSEGDNLHGISSLYS